ncbi:MAG: hypothetical protein ABI629_03430 [bacterium]
MVRSRWLTVGATALGLICCGPVHAAERIIDGFSDATAQTIFIDNVNVLQATVGTTTRTDFGMAEVIGGVRQLTVGATALAIPGLDYVVAGVVLPPIDFFEYNSRAGADGYITLLYDSGGSGLNRSVAFAQGIRVTILEADGASVVVPGLDFTLTLSDGVTTVSSTQTVTMPVTAMAPLSLDFLFTSFPGVDTTNLFSVSLTMDPQVAGDVRLATIETFGTPLLETVCNDGIDNNNNGFIDCRDQDCFASSECSTAAPAMSPLGIALALSMLALIGGLALRRMRQSDV